ncbi:MAG: phosphoribosylformylglycinamidine synthase I [Planctomycetia bacterium 21-64-5]|nr:MAG: phosphoribosylformylglycinamidine synthase I [Planctomycetia bacterium 21-64-5]HQU41878.1 phosphoribosylformylglycinamidine synthase I [Pirellulales bacterium]
MTQPRVLVLRAPGANCDRESAFAFERAGAIAERVHVYRLLERPALLTEYQILCIPGGFSYGDDLGAGRILGGQIQHHLSGALREFRDAGKLLLGICNGFQILIKSGMLLDDDAHGRPAATLTNNDSGKFEDRWIELRTSSDKCAFFTGIESMYLPVAHAEGKFVPRDAATLASLEAAGQLVLRYRPRGGGAAGYPDNPNGSVGAVAGVCDTTGRVCGLMPHPERHIDPTQHPRWTRGPLAREGDGLQVFRNAVEFFA